MPETFSIYGGCVTEHSLQFLPATPREGENQGQDEGGRDGVPESSFILAGGEGGGRFAGRGSGGTSDQSRCSSEALKGGSGA